MGTIIKVVVEGITPLLVNKFSDEAAARATEGAGLQHVDRPESHVDAANRLRVDERGAPIWPGPSILAALIAAGRFHKLGKNKLTTMRSSLIPSYISIEDLYSKIISAGGWKVDSRPVRMPATGGRILRHRPCFDDWKVCFTILLEDGFPEKLLRAVTDDSLTKIGWGDFRPSCRGPFGRSKVVNWAASNNGKKC